MTNAVTKNLSIEDTTSNLLKSAYKSSTYYVKAILGKQLTSQAQKFCQKSRFLLTSNIYQRKITGLKITYSWKTAGLFSSLTTQELNDLLTNNISDYDLSKCLSRSLRLSVSVIRDYDLAERKIERLHKKTSSKL